MANSSLGLNVPDLSKVFSPSGRRIPEGDKKHLAGRKENIIFKMGTVEAIDDRKQELFIKIHNEGGYATNVPITHPFVGTNSYIAGMPDEGTIVILGYQESQNKYHVLSYLPNYYAALEGKTVKLWDDDIVKNAGVNDYFYRFRKLSKGEIAIASSKGPELFLSDSVYLTSGLGDSFVLNNNAFISTSNNNYEFSLGVFKNSGIAYRNSLDVYDINSIFKESLSDGKNRYSLKADKLSGLNAKYFTEYLIEVADTSTKIQSKNDVNSDGTNLDKKNSIAIFSLGNFIGNNPVKMSTYAKTLGVVIFKDRNDENGNFRFIPLNAEDSEKKGLAITLYKPDRSDYEKGAFLGIDKEGRYFQYIPTTGISAQILSKGSKKEEWGADSYGNSWDINLKGGIRINIGKHNQRDPDLANKSVVIKLAGRVSTIYGNVEETLYDINDSKKVVSDTSSYNVIHKVEDKERYEVEGTREKRIGGKEVSVIEGIKDESIASEYNLLVAAGMKHSVSDVYTINVSKEKRENVGSRTINVTKGSSELILDTKSSPSVISNIIETIKLKGNREFQTGLGSIKEKITKVGNRSFETESGSISFKIKNTGNITMQTKTGNAVLKTNSGGVTVEGSTQVDIKTKAGVTVKGSKIDLKGKGLMAGVITAKTHKDYITGAFLVGSKTVKASGNIGG